MQRAFHEELARARHVERACTRWLAGRGWWLLPGYESGGEDKAPRLIGRRDTLIIPDLLGMQRHRRLWFEVKLKTRCTFHNRTQTDQTGFDERHHTHYLRVERETGIPVIVLFVHQKEGEVRGGLLHVLDRKAYDHTDSSRGKRVRYYRWRDLQRFARYDEVVQ